MGPRIDVKYTTNVLLRKWAANMPDTIQSVYSHDEYHTATGKRILGEQPKPKRPSNNCEGCQAAPAHAHVAGLRPSDRSSLPFPDIDRKGIRLFITQPALQGTLLGVSEDGSTWFNGKARIFPRPSGWGTLPSTTMKQITCAQCQRQWFEIYARKYMGAGEEITYEARYLGLANKAAKLVITFDGGCKGLRTSDPEAGAGICVYLYTHEDVKVIWRAAIPLPAHRTAQQAGDLHLRRTRRGEGHVKTRRLRNL